jgi:hypothetical protein
MTARYEMKRARLINQDELLGVGAASCRCAAQYELVLIGLSSRKGVILADIARSIASLGMKS